MTGSAFSRGSQSPQSLLSRYSVLRSNAVLGYGVGFVAFIPALALRFSLDAAIPQFPFITFIPAVVISAFLAGSRAGAFCAALSVLSAWYWFVDPAVPFSISFNAIVGLCLFGFIICVDIAIIEVAARAVDRLTDQEAQLNTIVETVPLGLIMAEFPSGKIVGGNKYVEQLLGHPIRYSPNIQSYSEWVSFHEDGSRVDATEYPFVAMMLRGEENPSIDVQYQRGDGSTTWTRILARPVKDVRGTITGGVAALIDIDEQHRNRIALNEALHAKELLLYEVNHRVKNSLQLVNSCLLIEASKIVNSEARSAVMAARDKINLIARVHHLLYESGTHENVSLENALEEIIHDLIVSAGRSDVELELCFSGNFMINIRQASPLVLVFNEIVTNALKYGLGSDNPKLTVSAVNTSDEMTLLIRDNGPGIAASTAEKKPGMGSQILEGLVSQMRGKLVIHSDCSGTEVVLTVPAYPKSADQKDAI